MSAGNDRNILVWTPDTETVAAYTRSLRGLDVEEPLWTGARFREWSTVDGLGDGESAREERSARKRTAAVAADSWSSDED